MSLTIDENIRYYDLPVEEEELSQSKIHYFVIKTLLAILEQLYKGQNVTIFNSINIYYPNQPAVAPDVAVIDKKLKLKRNENSYYINEKNPTPRVAIEIASSETWERDLKDKFPRYERMQIPEYFVFDPNEPRVWGKEWRIKGRLVGWFYNSNTNKLEPLPIEAPNRMWSNQLNSWLVVEPIDELYLLRLYEQDSVTLRPTLGEAQEAETLRADAAEAELERLRKLLEKLNGDNNR